MLALSNDKTKFICTDSLGHPCFMRGSHIKEANQMRVDLSKLDNKTFDFQKNGKGFSINEFLNKA